MALKSFYSSMQAFEVGDVVTSQSGTYGVELVARVYIEHLYVKRWVVRSVELIGGEKKDISYGSLALRSTNELRDIYTHLWTPGPEIVIRPGDVFKDADGNVYVASDSGTVWSVNSGGWNGVTVEGGKILWGWSSRTPLTMQTTMSGHRYSKKISPNES